MDRKDTKKHIVIINRSFWPDCEATGQLLTALARELTAGYRVTVIAGCSYYGARAAFKPLCWYAGETHDGIDIIRVRHTRFWKGRLAGRFSNWATYCILTFFAAVGVRADLLVVCTDPPFLGIMGAIIKWLRGIPYVYNCQDLYPDVVLAMGVLKRGAASALFDRLNTYALTRARVVIPIGESMKEKLRVKGIPARRMLVIPNWADTGSITPVDRRDNRLAQRYGLADDFVVEYSGNIGLAHDFSDCLRAFEEVQRENAGRKMHFFIIGEGAGKKNLERLIAASSAQNITLLPYQPAEDLASSLSMADLHIVLLGKGTAGTMVPSKVYGIMAAGRPYIAIADKESEPARIAQEYTCGFWAAPGDGTAVAKTLRWALEHPAQARVMGEAGRRAAETRYEKKVVLKEWAALVAGLFRGEGKN
ncbi:MAG: glycosyltransferase family 4 protein [Candidatus Omnitrophota bacterium]